MTKTRAVPNLQRGMCRISRGKLKAGLSIEPHVITQDDPSLSLDPMNKNAGVQITPITMAVRLEQGLCDEHPPKKMNAAANSQIDCQHRAHHESRRRQADPSGEVIRSTSPARTWMVREADCVP